MAMMEWTTYIFPLLKNKKIFRPLTSCFQDRPESSALYQTLPVFFLETVQVFMYMCCILIILLFVYV